MKHDEVLAPAVIAELRQAQQDYGNPAFIRQLVEMFQANAPVRMVKIRQAIAGLDARGLEQVAHTLKSNCGMLGATRMADHCAAFEACGERAAFDEAALLLADAEGEFKRVLGALADLLTELEG